MVQFVLICQYICIVIALAVGEFGKVSLLGKESVFSLTSDEMLTIPSGDSIEKLSTENHFSSEPKGLAPTNHIQNGQRSIVEPRVAGNSLRESHEINSTFHSTGEPRKYYLTGLQAFQGMENYTNKEKASIHGALVKRQIKDKHENKTQTEIDSNVGEATGLSDETQHKERSTISSELLTGSSKNVKIYENFGNKTNTKANHRSAGELVITMGTSNALRMQLHPADNHIQSMDVDRRSAILFPFIPNSTLSRIKRNTEFSRKRDAILNGGGQSPEHGVLPVEGKQKPVLHEESENYSSYAGQNHTPPSSENLCKECLCDDAETTVSCEHEHLDKSGWHHFPLTSANIPPTADHIRVMGFENVTVEPNIFLDRDSRVRKMEFVNIGNVHLVRDSFRFSAEASSNVQVELLFKNCVFDVIPDGTVTQGVKSYAKKLDFENTRFLDLTFERCQIGLMESNAIGKTRVNNFRLIHTKINKIATRSINIYISETWEVKDSELPSLPPRSMVIHADRTVAFSKNSIEELNNRSIEVYSKNQVLLEENKIGNVKRNALMGIIPQANGRGVSVVVMNNAFHSAELGSLLASDSLPWHEIKVIGNHFSVLCSCNVTRYIRALLDMNDNITHSKGEEEHYESIVDTSYCRSSEEPGTDKVIGDYLSDECASLPLLLIGSLSAAGILLLITVIISIVCCCVIGKSSKNGNYSEGVGSSSSLTYHPHVQPQSPLSVSVPSTPAWSTSSQPLCMYAIPLDCQTQETEIELEQIGLPRPPATEPRLEKGRPKRTRGWSTSSQATATSQFW